VKLKRVIKNGTTGSDARACKRALARAGYGPGKLGGITPVFGPFSVVWLNHWKKTVGLPQNGKIGQQALDKLAPWFDALALKWYADFTIPAKQVNPFAHARGLVPERTDDGVDYGGDRLTRIDALGRSRIIKAVTDSTWPGPYGSASGFNGTGGLIHGVFLDGPNVDEEWYLAEFMYVDVKAEWVVQAGQQIARFYHDARSGVGIEYGFGVGGSSQVATEAGNAWARLLLKTGAPVRDNPGPGSSLSPFGKIVR
jgi:hypothetical protein